MVAEDLYLLRSLDHVRLSPTGERVAYQFGWADLEARDNAGRIHVRALDSGSPDVELASPARRDHSPEWAPTADRLAFAGRLNGRDQIFVAPVEGGEALQLTELPDGSTSPAWSPDGRWIAFLGTVVADPEGVVDDPRPPETAELPRRPPVARVVRDFNYKHDGAGYSDGRRRHLFVVPAQGGQPVQLTDGPWSVEGFDWAPDGERLVVAGDAEPGADLRLTANLYLVDRQGGRAILVSDAELSEPAWSPRGDLIAFLAPLVGAAGAHDRVWVTPARGGEPRCLTASLDRDAAGSVMNDLRASHGGRLVWNETGDRLYFLASGPGTSEILSVDLNGAVREEAGGRRSILDFDARGGRLAFAASEPLVPNELHIVESGRETRLTDLNPWLGGRYLAEPEHMVFSGADGWEIDGWLMKPEAFDPSSKYPLVLEIHGGPHGQYGWAFFHEFQVLAGQGFLVFYLNPRGSDGKGEAFKQSCVRDWGGKDYEDLMLALDQLIERTGFVDESRLGVGGGSYGGFMTNWIIGHTDRFAAAVSMRSISNLVSEYCQHDIVPWGIREMGPYPWPDLDQLWERSPIRYVRNIRTPLLLTHAEMDLRCAISQAEELFGALRLLGREVEMVRFPGESHDLSRNGRPDRRVERLNRISGWFGSHLLERQPQAAAVAGE